MIRFACWTLLFAASTLLLPASLCVAAEKSEEITIYRDEFGTPHIFASTAEGACFAHGYAQASDRLEELLKQYMRRQRHDERGLRPRVLSRRLPPADLAARRHRQGKVQGRQRQGRAR